MKFFNASARRNFHSIQLLGSSHQKVFLSSSFWNLSIGISASASSLECANCPQNFFWKNRILMFFLVLSHGISTTLLQILISLRFPIRPSKGGHWCSIKKLFELPEASIHWCFEKITSPKISACFLFKYTHRPYWDFSKKLFSYSVDSLLTPVSVKRNSAAHAIRDFPEF